METDSPSRKFETVTILVLVAIISYVVYIVSIQDDSHEEPNTTETASNADNADDDADNNVAVSDDDDSANDVAETGPAVAVSPGFCEVTEEDKNLGVQPTGNGVRLMFCTLPDGGNALCQVSQNFVPFLCLAEEQNDGVAMVEEQTQVEALTEQPASVSPKATEPTPEPAPTEEQGVQEEEPSTNRSNPLLPDRSQPPKATELEVKRADPRMEQIHETLRNEAR